MSKVVEVYFECDHPTCNKKVKGPQSQLSSGILGYARDMSLAINPREEDSNWFACREAHISGAVKTILERQRRGNDKR
jgi:hypothetical protein